MTIAMNARRSALGEAIGAGAFAAVLVGVADSFMTILHNPDPALWSYRAGYVIGPILIDLGYALPVAVAVGAVMRFAKTSSSGAARVAVIAITAVWGASLLLQLRQRAEGPAGLAIATVVLAIAMLGMIRLALDAHALALRCPTWARRTAWLGGAMTIAGACAGVSIAAGPIAGGGSGLCSPALEATPDHPSILLISIDALRADAARSMQSYRRLAGRGLEYDAHSTSSPWTLPAIASLLTGLPPDAHGAGRSLSTRSLLARTALARNVPTVASVLGTQGYRTHAIVTNPFLTPQYGIDSGFCTFENLSTEREAVRGMSNTTVLRLVSMARLLAPSDRADAVRSRAERWIQGHRRERFFLWLHFLDPHAPYGDTDASPTSLTLDLMAFQNSRGLERPFTAVGLLRSGEYRPDPYEREAIRELYRQDVEFADRELMRLLAFIERDQADEDLAIVFTADHGEEFWDHGGTEHGRTLHEEVTHVPLIIALPGGNAVPRERVSPTSAVDVAATIAAIAGSRTSIGQGRDLLDTTSGSDHPITIANTLFGTSWEGIRLGSLKYMRSEFGEEHLYDLASDPDEYRDLVSIRPDDVRQLRTKLRTIVPPDGVVSAAGVRGTASKEGT